MLKQIFYIAGAVAVGAGLVLTMQHYLANKPFANDEQAFCTMDARQCPDGTYVGRTGSNCEFVCPPTPELPDNIKAHIESKSNLIQLSYPLPSSEIKSPLLVTGKARGNWFFEASFPVTLTNWDGLIIAEGIATAEGEWMTEEFVPFKAELDFVNPYESESPEFMQRGSLILQKDNPSGEPKFDDALEIPVLFAQ